MRETAEPSEPPTISPQRLHGAYAQARRILLDERTATGHWVGELSNSALSTATAVSALAVVAKANPGQEVSAIALTARITAGVHWLVSHQNQDGGWGDTNQSYSNIATSMVVVAALHLAGQADEHAELIRRATNFIESQGHVAGLRRRYGRDKTFAVPILTNCALAGLVEWRQVSALPFELACFPQSFYRMLSLPVVSYAIPALVAIGQARYFHQRPWNPLTRWIRSRSIDRSLRVLEKMQPASGGYLEAVPLTSFVVMSLASTRRVNHAVTRRGLQFILDSVRPDGSWPIDTNLATWNTTLALNALARAGEELSEQKCLDWLLACQHKQIHPYTGAEPGGWGWTDLSGAVPDADDTPGALLALASWSRSCQCCGPDRRRIRDAAAAGIRWLHGLQNRDGGWPTFCRGWGHLPFDRSGSDLTAHAIRALHAWNDLVDSSKPIQRGLTYLEHSQRPDGSWIPLWFGNQDDRLEENPVYGTAKVLAAYRDLDLMATISAKRGCEWLVQAGQPNGSWGSVEETALAVDALLGEWSAHGTSTAQRPELAHGLNWLIESVDTGRFREPSPIGFYFAKLWYYEKLYPIILSASALGHAARLCSALAEPPAASSRQLAVANHDPKQPCP